MRKLIYLIIIIVLSSCANNTNPIANSSDSTITDSITPKDTPDIIYTDCIIKGDHSFDVDDIIRSLKTDTNWVEYNKECIAILNKSKEDKLALFPYSEVDSAVFLYYKVDIQNSKAPDSGFIDSNFRFGTILCKEKIQALLNLFNNPTNFGWGEFGTPLPNSHILFFNKGEQVGRVVFCNGHFSQSYSFPKNTLSRFGLLNETGNDKLWEINLNK